MQRYTWGCKHPVGCFDFLWGLKFNENLSSLNQLA